MLIIAFLCKARFLVVKDINLILPWLSLKRTLISGNVYVYLESKMRFIFSPLFSGEGRGDKLLLKPDTLGALLFCLILTKEKQDPKKCYCK